MPKRNRHQGSIFHEEDGVREKIFQPYVFPDLNPECGKCGSDKHRMEACPQLSPWKAALMGRESGAGSSQHGEKEGYIRQRRPEIGSRKVDNEKGGTRQQLVIKVGIIVRRATQLDSAIWIPTQEWQTTFPVWTLTQGHKGLDTLEETWQKAENKMMDMLAYDFLGLPEEILYKLLVEAQKYILTHRAQGEAVYVYLPGALSVDKEFDTRPEKRRCWVARKTLALQIKDSRLAQGTVPMSTRVLAAGLQRIVFEHIDLRITVPGSVILQSKAKMLEEVERCKENESGGNGKGKGKLLEIENGEQEGRVVVIIRRVG